MVVGEVVVCFDDCVQIGFHELKHDVDVLEGPWIGGQQDVLDFYDVCARKGKASSKQG